MVNFIMMIGLPGSGKSTLAKAISYNIDAEIFSSDSIRNELYGDESTQGDPNKVFNILHKRVINSLKNGKSCVYDATNISEKRRTSFLDNIKNIDCVKTCIFVAVPVEECKKRNCCRDRVVPDHVIERMANQFDPPAMWEGWDNIRVAINDFCGFYGESSDFVNNYIDYNQENSHHSLTLGEHCKKAKEFVQNGGFEDTDILSFVAEIHDCGKPYTKFFKDGDSNAHFYGHQNRGAYNSFFYSRPDSIKNEYLTVALYVRWHMQPYFWENDPKSKEDALNKWGERFFNNILRLHEADQYAH